MTRLMSESYRRQSGATLVTFLVVVVAFIAMVVVVVTLVPRTGKTTVVKGTPHTTPSSAKSAWCEQLSKTVTVKPTALLAQGQARDRHDAATYQLLAAAPGLPKAIAREYHVFARELKSGQSTEAGTKAAQKVEAFCR